MSSQLDRVVELTFRRRKQVAALTLVLSVASSIIAIAHYFVPLVSYEGWLASGFVGISAHKLLVAGREVSIKPLESLSLISLVLLVLAIASLFFAALAVFGHVKLRESLYLEGATISAFSAALAMSLLFSIMGVVVDEILPALPQRGSVSTSAGVLTFERSKEYKSSLYLLFEDYGIYMVLLSASLFLLSALVLYSYWRLEETEVELSSP
ncbi:MAG: hypothetical protein ABDH61_00275 [Acidilobaceae archaeon]